ncbi:MAG TPA: putative Ig domain-containing protein, partial [Steroidobacteraceae bacterium]|nr:putative Ig domain-containing protein [Steroidobacteraceae bacterium]
TTGKLAGTPTAAGTFSNIIISASDGKLTASLPAFAIKVNPVPNSAPVISGTPLKSIDSGTSYSFKPSASDADGDALTFSIANRPAWAAFNTSTGQLSGTPSSSNAGSFANIIISVSDGKANAALPAFSINVIGDQPGTASLTWTAPIQNVDGSTLTDLAGYRISYGTSSTALSQTIQVANPSLTSYLIEALPAGTYYFAVRAYTTHGTESANSNLASKAVR